MSKGETDSDRFQESSLGANVRQAGGRNDNKTCEATPDLNWRVPQQQAKLLHLTYPSAPVQHFLARYWRSREMITF
jgi:hypothetical protein